MSKKINVLTEGDRIEIKAYIRANFSQRWAFQLYDERTVKGGSMWSMKIKPVSRKQQTEIVKHLREHYEIEAEKYVITGRYNRRLAVKFHYFRA